MNKLMNFAGNVKNKTVEFVKENPLFTASVVSVGALVGYSVVKNNYDKKHGTGMYSPEWTEYFNEIEKIDEKYQDLLNQI